MVHSMSRNCIRLFSSALRCRRNTKLFSTFNHGRYKRNHFFCASALVIGGLSASCLLISSNQGLCDAKPMESNFDWIQTALHRKDFVHLSTTDKLKHYVTAVSKASYASNNPIEDRYDTYVDDERDAYFAVFDGHGGWQAAEYAEKHLIASCREEISKMVGSCPSKLHDNIFSKSNSLNEPSLEEIKSAIRRAYERTDRGLMSHVKHAFEVGFGSVARVGSCALMAYIRGNQIYIANAGDVRAVIGRKDKNQDEIFPVQLSNDHNAKIQREKERLAEEHPGEDNIVVCKSPTACYVKGRLQPTRSLGDFYLKYPEFNGPPYTNGDRSRGRHIPYPYTPPYITATPEITTYSLSSDDSFMIIGSDGLWDFLDNQEAVDIVQHQINSGTPNKASQALIGRVLEKAASKHGFTIDELMSIPPGRSRRNKHDDTTVLVVFLR